MRIAILSDIHGNGTAFEAVLADLKETAPDLVLHGGDLADGGPAGAVIVDRIRDLGWQGVGGNTDEMLATPETFETFAAAIPNLQSMWDAIREIAAWSRERLGGERLAWLGELPRELKLDGLALVHASPESAWRSPGAEASDSELETTYETLKRAVVAYGHIHKPYVRHTGALTVVNTGSVGLPYDGDRRASYALVNDGTPSIRRVEYDVERQIKALRDAGAPHADWAGRMLMSAAPAQL